MGDSVGGKQPQAASPGNAHHALSLTPGFFAPALVIAVSLPLGFLFALGIRGAPLTYAIGIIGFGILTALDLKRGLLRSVLGFAATLLILSYIIMNTSLPASIAPSGAFAPLIIALPPAIGVFLSTIVFTRKQRFRILKVNVLGTLATVAGLVIVASGGSIANLIGSNPIALSLFAVVGFGANCIQMVLLFFLDKLWQTRNSLMTVLPTAFFSYNAIMGYDYFTAPTAALGYIFFSSLGYLPLLTLSGVAASALAVRMLKAPTKPVAGPSKTPVTPVSPPRISFAGDHSVKQGHIETIKVTTESDGGPRDMANVVAEIQTPAGKREHLRIARTAIGKYIMSFQAPKPGNYNIRVTATNKGRQTTKESFSFTVQPSQPPAATQPQTPPSQPRPAPSSPPPGQRIQLPPAPSKPQPAPVSKTPISYTRQGIPALTLNSWDPKVWVGQEVHGYHVVEHIATGASGYVLRATFGQAGTEVALKIPILKTTRPTNTNEPTAGTMTLNETMSEATRLLELSGQSKYVVQIRGILVDRLNVQEIMKGDTALYYHSPPAIVMEYMKGSTAKKLIEDPEYEPLYYSEKWGGLVVLVGQMMAMALDMIHKAGFVHLDVKPQNVLFNTKPPLTGQEMLDRIVSGDLLPKLADLGSAVKKGGKVIQFTSEYAPGEQVLGDPAEPSMDVYALGAALYTMLTRTPVHSPKLIEAMNNVTTSPELNKAMKELDSVWDSYDPDFSRIDPKFTAVVPILKQMLSGDPRKRPDAGSVATSLQRLVDKRGLLS
jgi:serine/threonine protein kinase